MNFAAKSMKARKVGRNEPCPLNESSGETHQTLTSYLES
jgi:hypothetical protein